MSRCAQAGILSLALWGCGNVESTPAQGSAEFKSPPAVAQPLPAPEHASPLDELKQYMTPQRSRLAIAGGAAVLLSLVVIWGVVKLLKGAPPPPAETPPGV